MNKRENVKTLNGKSLTANEVVKIGNKVLAEISDGTETVFSGAGFSRYSSTPTRGAITITNHKTCGKRLMIDNEVWRTLDCPEYLDFIIKGDNLLVIIKGESMNRTRVSFTPKMSVADAIASDYSKKIIAYNGKIASALWDKWNLGIYGNTCCVSVGDIQKVLFRGQPAVLVTYNGLSTKEEDLSEEDSAEEETKPSDVDFAEEETKPSDAVPAEEEAKPSDVDSIEEEELSDSLFEEE